jgi:hypothetical protein
VVKTSLAGCDASGVRRRPAAYTPDLGRAAAYAELYAEYRSLHDHFGRTAPMSRTVCGRCAPARARTDRRRSLAPYADGRPPLPKRNRERPYAAAGPC